MIKEIFGKKIGMTQTFDSKGNIQTITLVEVEPVCLLEKMDYPTKSAVRIGCFKIKENRLSKLSKPLTGYFKKIGVAPYKLIQEVAIEKGADLSFIAPKAVVAVEKPAEVQAEAQAENKETVTENVESTSKREIGLEIFKEGDTVDVRGKNKGHGFAGGMKRHNWHGGPGGHGSMFHRRIGSNGANTDPGRVVRGHRMPGHYGDKFCTVKNLKIIKIDAENNLLFISGSIPGARNAVVKVKKV
jgi:large subunit ribosomal protein L3